jgi:protein ImuA
LSCRHRLSPVHRRLVLEQLRAELARHGGTIRTDGMSPVMAFGLERLDRVLPGGGLATAGVHELCGRGEQAALGFAGVLLGRFGQLGPVLWIRQQGDLYAPGLAELGLGPERLIVVRARARGARLWALEEVLRTTGVAAGVAEVDRLSLTESRRLQLAAEAGGTAGLLLRSAMALASPSAALTRWRIAPLAGTSRAGPRGFDLSPPRWHLELVRCRGGGVGAWRIEWRNGGFHEIADPLALAAPSRDRPAQARSA